MAVEVLKLAQLSVEHFMAPNLALLVDTLSGSDMQKLGPTIMKRLHDVNWEVRDTVLELLASMANISLASESCVFLLSCVFVRLFCILFIHQNEPKILHYY